MRNVKDPGGVLNTLLDGDVGEVQLLELGLGCLTSAASGGAVVALQ